MIKLNIVRIGHYAFEAQYLGLEATGSYEVDWDDDIPLVHIVDIFVKAVDGTCYALPLENLNMDELEDEITARGPVLDWDIGRAKSDAEATRDMER